MGPFTSRSAAIYHEDTEVCVKGGSRTVGRTVSSGASLALQFISCVMLGRFPNFSVPLFPRINIICLTRLLGELNKKIHVKH